MFELPDDQETSAVIKVIGIGGGGGNALEHMLESNLHGVEFVCANTDLQALRKSKAKVLLQLGEGLTKGLGAGANPEVGRQAAEENRDLIRELLTGTDMVFLTAGMGGGTGTGAAPIFAEIARELGVLTVAVVTRPFLFEGPKRTRLAMEGIAKLASQVDSLITIPNDKLLPVLGKDVSLVTAFNTANDVLLGAVQGISELITRPGLINVDFADVRTVMSEMGMAMMGTACASGENRAKTAAEAAIASPLLEDIDLKGARGVLVNITAGPSISIGEFEDVGAIVRDFAADEATVVVGTVIDEEMDDSLRVTVVVTGLTQMSTARSSVKQEVNDIGGNCKINESDNISGSELGEKSAGVGSGGAGVSTGVAKEGMGDAYLEDDIDYLDIPAFLRMGITQDKDKQSRK